MNRASQSRRIVALVAAYFIGLQALLLPLSVAAGGVFTIVLCSAGASVGNAQGPLGHDNGCPCAAGCGMQCGAHALAGPPQTVIALASPGAVSLLPPPTIDAAPRLTLRRPQLARAPPAA
jgi:hypothetical protein